MLFRLKKMILILALVITSCIPVHASTQGSGFPRLDGHYEVVGAATPRYNCIAWSLGITSKWVWPGTSINDFDRLNASHGYRRMSNASFKLQRGIHKIVLYGKLVNGRFEATHQAKQLADGTWSSKLGKGPLIRHEKPDDLDGPTYGRPFAVYFRYV